MNTPDNIIGPINLGNPEEFTIKQLSDVIIDLIGSKSKIVYLPQVSDDPMQRQPVIDKAREILNWKPSVSLKDGLIRTIAYFEEELKRS